jgi:hypothetical protein
MIVFLQMCVSEARYVTERLGMPDEMGISIYGINVPK